MSTSARASEAWREPVASGVEVTEEALVVELSDGRTLLPPLVWYPRLTLGSAAERGRRRLVGGGEGAHREDHDEDINVEGCSPDGRPPRVSAR